MNTKYELRITNPQTHNSIHQKPLQHLLINNPPHELEIRMSVRYIHGGNEGLGADGMVTCSVGEMARLLC